MSPRPRSSAPWSRHPKPSGGVALWLVPDEGSGEPERIWLTCGCGAESIVEPVQVYPTKLGHKQRIQRAPYGSVASITNPDFAYEHAGKAICRGCGRLVEVRIIGRLGVSMDLGVGLVRVMPPFPEARDDCNGGPK